MAELTNSGSDDWNGGDMDEELRCAYCSLES
jgi:hypothetical protein